MLNITFLLNIYFVFTNPVTEPEKFNSLCPVWPFTLQHWLIQYNCSAFSYSISFNIWEPPCGLKICAVYL